MQKLSEDEPCSEVNDKRQKILDLYSFDFDLPSLKESLPEKTWKVTKKWSDVSWVDYHPLPLDHLSYVNRFVAPSLGLTITEDTREWVEDWQTRLSKISRWREASALTDWSSHPKESF